MKRISIMIALLLAATVISGCGKKTEDNSFEEEVIKTEESMIRQPEETPSQTIEDASEGLGGGNEFSNNGESGDLMTNDVEVIAVLVSKDDYFYENKPIELDEILAIILQYKKEDIMVELGDDDATYRAYQRLVDELDELEIPYTEE